MADVKNSSLATGLISYWELEEASGTRIDSHGPNDLQDINTVGQATGIQGNCADFERSNNEQLEITDASQTGLDITDTISISAWVKLEQLPSSGGAMGIVAKYSNAAGGYRFDFLANNKLLWAATQSAAPLTRDVYIANATLTGGDIGTWMHVVVTYDASTRTTILYKNGSVIAGTNSPAGTLTQIANNSEPFYVGNIYTSIDYPMDGLIDEVGIWDRVLSPSEVSDLDNSGAGIPYDASGGGTNEVLSIAGVSNVS